MCPRAMTRTDMDRVTADFVAGARSALPKLGFDWLELHCAHGYLLSSFISPLTNQRTDDLRRLASPTACATRSKCLPRCAQAWPKICPCRCAFRRTTGWKAASRRAMRSRSPRLQGRGCRHDRLLFGSGQCKQQKPVPTAACIKHRLPTASAKRRASPPSQWVPSLRPTMSTASWPQGAPTCAPWHGRIWPTRPGH